MNRPLNSPNVPFTDGAEGAGAVHIDREGGERVRRRRDEGALLEVLAFLRVPAILAAATKERKLRVRGATGGIRRGELGCSKTGTDSEGGGQSDARRGIATIRTG